MIAGNPNAYNLYGLSKKYEATGDLHQKSLRSEKYTEDQKQTALVVRSVAFTAVCCIMNSAMRTFLNVIRQYSIPFCILHIGKLWQIISGVSKSDGA